MTKQKAPFKYCYSFSSDQKHHPCKVTLFFQKSTNIQGSSLSQNYERQHFGIYHSHRPLKVFIYFPKFHSESKGKYNVYHNLLPKPLPGRPVRCNVGHSLSYDLYTLAHEVSTLPLLLHFSFFFKQDDFFIMII